MKAWRLLRINGLGFSEAITCGANRRQTGEHFRAAEYYEMAARLAPTAELEHLALQCAWVATECAYGRVSELETEG
jgi:hypothetical protein